jgi:hypothetical protein
LSRRLVAPTRHGEALRRRKSDEGGSEDGSIWATGNLDRKDFNAKTQRRDRSSASADRRNLKPKMKMAVFCRDAATKSFQRDLSRRNQMKADDPDGNGDGAALPRTCPGNMNVHFISKF